MSTTTITYLHYEDGVLADANSVTLEDPTGQYAIQRLDTLAAISGVDVGTELTRDSEGTYTYTFTDPAPGIRYRAHFKVETTSQVLCIRQDTETASDSDDIEGRYATQAGMRSRFGDNSILRWASVNGENDVTAIYAAITEAIEQADAYVDGALQGSMYTVPFDADAVPVMVSKVANTLAGIFLYEAQGSIDFDADSGQPQHRYAGLKKQAERMLAQIKLGKLRLVLSDGTAVDRTSRAPFAGEVPPIAANTDGGYW